MRLLLLSIMLVVGLSTTGQSLKDSLYGGRLKPDTTKKPLTKEISAEYAGKKTVVPDTTDHTGTKPIDLMLDERRKVWKKYMELNAMIINMNAMEAKKVKDGEEYHLLVKFEIDTAGKIEVLSITCKPHNGFLINETNEFMKRAPVLPAPVWSDGQPRKAVMIQPMTFKNTRE